MRLPRLWVAVVCDIFLLLSESRLVVATPAPSTPTPTDSPKKPVDPLWIEPSGEWFDSFDGKWSNFMFVVGFSPVYLTPATALSEIWTISTGGCMPTQLCFDARGGVVDFVSSPTWRSLGAFQLGREHTGYYGGNGDYGLETVAFVNTITSHTTDVKDVLVAAINDTNYYQGYIGLGVTQGVFNKTNLTNPFIPQLAQKDGAIPSHSYGYTAGAYYRPNGKSDGTVASLTLGGYDKMRFDPHNTNFPLDPITRIPTVRLRGITAQVSSLDKAPASNWTSTSRALVTMEDSITAIIDSSTPYLWLPTEVCDRFAAALNLTWREDLGVYVFQDGPQYTRFVTGNSLSFTFTLSGFDNTDNFGQPLNVPGVVNITAPSAAFAHVLRYPFRGAIKYGESAIPYFPLKRSTKEINNNVLIIGRAFMQEAYIITRYDRSIFSIHQALFPENAASNYSLEGIERPPNSPYPEYTDTHEKPPREGLTQGQTAGIALGAFTLASIVGFTTWCCCRRRRKRKNVNQEGKVEESKNFALHVEEEEPTSPVKRMFTKIIRKKKPKKTGPQEVDGTSKSPVEVGADEQHQVFELPVPIEPVELDSHDVGDEDTDVGVDSFQGVSEYELTRRKLERQMLGPVPTYSPTDTMVHVTRLEKSMQDVASTGHYRPTEEPSPVSTPTYANTNSLPDCLPSPMSPQGDWPGRMFDLPSPMTVVPPSHFHQGPSTGSEPSCSYSPVSPHSPNSQQQNFVPSSVSRSDPDNVSPTSLTGSMRLPAPTFQRTPIDDSRVVCLGPLPEGVELPHHRPPIIPRILGPDGRAVPVSPISPISPHTPASPLPPPGPLGHYRSDTNGSSDTLGSNYTEEEGRLVAEAVQRTYQTSGLRQEETHQQVQQNSREDAAPPSPQSPRSLERIESSIEFIHVPQVAHKRYSWEEPESSGGGPRQD